MTTISTALCLPAPDIEALNQGRNILLMPRRFMRLGEQFALYPTNIEFNSLPLEQYYRPGFIPIAKQSIAELNQDKVKIKVWAKCELCQTLDQPEEFETLSKLTVWTAAALHKTLEQRGHIFLAYFRVYRLPQPLEIDPVSNSRFISLPYSIMVDESQAILDDNNFERQYRKILNRQPPEHPELEELENAIAPLTLTHPDAKFLKDRIQTFLGWQPAKPPQIPENLNWIYTINELGTTAEGGNYEKGTAFENIVHQSLNFLGFELDQNAKGGAGGMDLYCTKPYPMVGECKAGQSIPAGATQELIRLGGTHLGQQLFNQAVKLIIGPGKPTPQVQKSAQEFKISIINPMTLEKLVKLQAQYPGSVDLIELKKYFKKEKGDQEEWGQMDDNIDKYIKIVFNRLQLRSQIIKAIKELNTHNSSSLNLPTQNCSVVEVRVQHNAKYEPKLNDNAVRDLLIELSSPLAGYLGRNRADDWRNDSFYYLRELIVDQSQGFD
ncbi:DUF1802 family protein [Planktothrix agardhii]|uniref:DUF1802 family protein n=1 Tax=Planktothrix agardhii TaxID=1160 RepID=UPI0020B3D426|nr:DUF1802 family protein [Planktothrix agardhii]CAD5912128.1 hypothetical protein PCC7811_00106 [Planktothrix agardhii]